MLDLKVTIEGDKVLIAGLQRLQKEIPNVIRGAIFKVAQEIHREASENLKGPGRKSVRKRTRARGQFDLLGARPGSYPVPVLTGHLRRSLDFVKPGESKTSNGITFRAGKFEAIVYNSAEYANVIHEGKLSSAKYGRRPYLDDAVKKVNIQGILEAEINRFLKI